MPPNVVEIHCPPSAQKPAYASVDAMIMWMLAKAEQPGRTEGWTRSDVRRFAAESRRLVARFADGRPPDCRDNLHRAADGSLLLDADAFGRLVRGGIDFEGVSAPDGRPLSNALTARIAALSRTSLVRAVTTALTIFSARAPRSPLDSAAPNAVGMIPTQLFLDVGEFVARRCRLSGDESCSGDVLRRAYVAWAARAGAAQLGIAEFLRAIAEHARCAIDVGTQVIVVLGVAPSDDHATLLHATPSVPTSDPEAHRRHADDPLAEGPSTRADDESPCLSTMAGRTRRGAEERASLPDPVADDPRRQPQHERKKRKREEAVEHHADDDDDDDDDDGARQKKTARGEASKKRQRRKRTEGEEVIQVEGRSFMTSAGRTIRFTSDTTAVSARDLVREATRTWDDVSGNLCRTSVDRLRRDGWTFVQARLGRGLPTPLVRVDDMDDFLIAIAGGLRDRAQALFIHEFIESDAYASLWERLGRTRAAGRKRVAATIARDAIIAQGLDASPPTMECDGGDGVPASDNNNNGDDPDYGALDLNDVSDDDDATDKCAREKPSACDDDDDDGDYDASDESDAASPSPRSPPSCSLSDRSASTARGHKDAQERRKRTTKRRGTAVAKRTATTTMVVARKENDTERSTKGAPPPLLPPSPTRLQPPPSPASRTKRRRAVHSSTDSGSDDDGCEKDKETDATPTGNDDQKADSRWRVERTPTAPKRPPPPPPPLASCKGTGHNDEKCDVKAPAANGVNASQRTERRDARKDGAPPEGPFAPAVRDKEGSGDGIEAKARRAEQRCNGKLVEFVMDQSRPNIPACAWHRVDNRWRLVLAVRPGRDAARPWRIVHDDRNGGDATPARDVWVDRDHVRATLMDLVALPQTVLSLDADAEPPAPGDPSSIDFSRSWLMCASRHYAKRSKPARGDAAHFVRYIVARLGGLCDEGTVHRTPFGPECAALLAALERRLA